MQRIDYQVREAGGEVLAAGLGVSIDELVNNQSGLRQAYFTIGIWYIMVTGDSVALK
ncbi:hypothetical protein [Desulfosporosinus sp. BG]|uniref:hypothetical protein n=1 Tax=Desulfosporosinus sp. BG TaxID=1633135 RepID=UPI0008555D20|nr:hypothetical protein [Desulfosporosinus sp. BG]ODA41930.1 hypothetical protein DSBG_1200 [Desulfosporosinus sp. BG]